MKNNYHRNIALTFFISTIWCVYVFFDYYSDRSFLSGLTLFFDFFTSAIFVIGISTINLLIRFTKFQKQNTEKFKETFFYIFAGFSNLILSAIYFVYLIVSNNVKEFFAFENNDTYLVLGNLILGVCIILDLYSNYLWKNKTSC